MFLLGASVLCFDFKDTCRPEDADVQFSGNPLAAKSSARARVLGEWRRASGGTQRATQNAVGKRATLRARIRGGGGRTWPTSFRYGIARCTRYLEGAPEVGVFPAKLLAYHRSPSISFPLGPHSANHLIGTRL